MPPFDPFTKEVLFVNRDPSNLRRRSRQEAFAINSHVNGSYTRWRRKESWKHLRSQARRFITAQSAQVKQEEHQVPISGASLFGTIDFTTEASQPKRPARPIDDVREEDTHQEEPKLAESASTSSISYPHGNNETTLLSMRRALRSSPTTILQKGNSDPFDATPVPLTALNHHAVKFACVYHVTNIWPSEISESNPDNLSNVKWWISPRQSIKQQPTMLGLLAWSFEILQRDGRERDSVRALEFKNSAIVSLRQLMQSLTDFNSRLAAYETMLYFGAAEWNARNLESMINHYQAAKTVLSSIGGLQALDARWRETSIWAMVNVTFTFAIRPLVDPKDFDPGPWKELSQLAINATSDEDRTVCLGGWRGDGFDASVAQISGPVLSAILDDIRNLLCIEEAEHNRTSFHADENKDLSHWFFARKLALRARLVNHFFDLSESFDAVAFQTNRLGGFTATAIHSSLELCLCLGLMLYELITFEKHAFGLIWFRRFRWIKGRHEMLVGCLEKLKLTEVQQASKLGAATNLSLLWMLFVGAYAETAFLSQKPQKIDGQEFTDEEYMSRIYCTGRFPKWAKVLGFEDVGQIRDLFKKYFVFCPRTQNDALRKIFEDA